MHRHIRYVYCVNVYEYWAMHDDPFFSEWFEVAAGWKKYTYKIISMMCASAYSFTKAKTILLLLHTHTHPQSE